MRIVVLGDFHIDGQHPELTIKAMEDVAMIAPDLVIPLGDFGRNGRIGRPEGLREAKEHLDRTQAPLRPIMGNHDLERESGGVQPSGTMEKAFLDIFGLQEPYGVLEFREWRLFFASTEPQPADSCYDVQECYATDRQFDALVTKLKERPGVPVIFFTHAPPIGSGLRTVPRVHVRSTNAYLDQNHDPYRWLELVRSFPEIVMWFSAHYHLSQGYVNSHTLIQGTHFFLTGVHSSCTRDGKRQSRVIDIHPAGLSVRTLDHIERRITEEGTFAWKGSPGTLMGLNVETASSFSGTGSQKLLAGAFADQNGAKR
ncbi:metallophosphoesterase family protein, partial [Paenibacillus antibioticophila]|uniref:metallophosphoesterase family protein n=1 Tax=Paenibacillus antibioticophila TaxID=1274374 RepID=UPI001651C50F